MGGLGAHQIREEGHGLFVLSPEELGDVDDVPLRQAQLPLQHLPVPVDTALGEQGGKLGMTLLVCIGGI